MCAAILKIIARIEVFSTIDAAQDVDKLSDFLSLIRLVARCDGVLDAVTDVIAKNFLFDTAKGCTDGTNLGYNVDTITVLIDHF